jgi:hypothetical protein
MLSRNLHIDFELVCITDNKEGLDSHIRPVIWPSYGLGRARRLQLFDKAQAERDIGKRILQLDLDCVITGDLTPLVNRPDPFVVWESVHNMRWMHSGDTGKLMENTKQEVNPFNSSMILMDAGVLPTLWNDYIMNAEEVETRARKAGHWTALVTDGKAEMIPPGDDDQAVMTLYARPLNPPTWGEADGVYKYKRIKDAPLPDNAKIVFFQGFDARNYAAKSPWIMEHLR